VKTVPNIVYRRHLFLTAILVFAVDQATKIWAVERLQGRAAIHVIGDFLKFSFVRNPGAAFSVGTGSTWVFAIVAILVCGAIIRISGTVTNKAWAFALGALLGGALGNLADRIFRSPGFLEGHVVDFIRLPHYPTFNVGDSAVVCAAIFMMYLSFRGIEYKSVEAKSSEINSSESSQS
jgi:signal peptidase II